MLESLRNFLSGKRVIVIAILLAIPFVFFGSTSFGTSFSSYGSVNGESVTQVDVNLATSQVSQRLQSIYGEEFSLDDLDEGVAMNLIKNEIINQKTLLSNVKDMGIFVSEAKAKQEIINLDMFQGDQGFDPTLFESAIRANGFSPEEYITLVQESVSLDKLLTALGIVAFPIEKDLISLASLLETSRDINFIKVDKTTVVDSQKASLEEGQAFYNENPFLFLSQEQRDFSYIVLTFEAYQEQVDIPEGYVKDAYADYLQESERQLQNRISHFMIEKSNYENTNLARESIESTLQDIQAGVVSFNDAVSSSSDDLASRDTFGDLGLSSGDAFPEEFENAIPGMTLDGLSDIIELEDSFHILQLTEILKPEIKSKALMEKQLLKELIEGEALALMQDDFLKLEAMVLEGATFQALVKAANQTIEVTGLKGIDNISLQGYEDISAADLFDESIAPNKVEIFESENAYAFAMMTQAIDPYVQPFIDVAELAIREVRVQKADKLLEEFSVDAEEIILGSKTLPQAPGFSIESFKSVKRFSSLLPSEVINLTFESPIGTVVTSSAFNGDRYWAKSSNEIIPSAEELGDSLEQYKSFYNENLGQKFSGFIDRAFKKNQTVRLKNFNSN